MDRVQVMADSHSFLSSRRRGVSKGNDKRHHLNLSIAQSESGWSIDNGHESSGKLWLMMWSLMSQCTDRAMETIFGVIQHGHAVTLCMVNMKEHHLLGKSSVGIVFSSDKTKGWSVKLEFD